MKAAVIHTLGYFNLFKHPLTRNELRAFLSVEISQEKLNAVVDALLAEGAVSETGGFVQLATSPDLAALRQPKEERARMWLRKVPRYAGIIARFPFVRAVAVSGSISKLSATENADVDFFIVTAKNRLWIARTLLHLFKKLTFITGHQHLFCMNYFVDESRLALPQENIFTAIELYTLIPVYNGSLVQQLKAANPWVRTLLPNHDGTHLAHVQSAKPFSPLKPLCEAVINLCAPVAVNHALMRLTDRKWRRKFAHLRFSESDYDRAMLTRPWISKNHPFDFQKKVLTGLDAEYVVGGEAEGHLHLSIAIKNNQRKVS